MELLNLFLTFLYVPLNYYSVKCEEYSYEDLKVNYSLLIVLFAGDTMCSGTHLEYSKWDSISRQGGKDVSQHCNDGKDRSVEENCFYYFYSLRNIWLTHLQSEFPGVPFHLPNTVIDSGYDCNAEFYSPAFSQISRMMLADMSPLHKYLGQVCQDMKRSVFRATGTHFRVSPLAVFDCFKRNSKEIPPEDIGNNLLIFMEIDLYKNYGFHSPISFFSTRFKYLVYGGYCCQSSTRLMSSFCQNHRDIFTNMYLELTSGELVRNVKIVPWLEYPDGCTKWLSKAVQSYEEKRSEVQPLPEDETTKSEMMYPIELGFPYTHNRLLHMLIASIMCQTMMFFGYREGRKYALSRVSRHRQYLAMMTTRFAGAEDQKYYRYKLHCELPGARAAPVTVVTQTGFSHLDLAMTKFLSCVDFFINNTKVPENDRKTLLYEKSRLLKNYAEWHHLYLNFLEGYKKQTWSQLWDSNNQVMFYQHALNEKIEKLGAVVNKATKHPHAPDSKIGCRSLSFEPIQSFRYYIYNFCDDFKSVPQANELRNGMTGQISNWITNKNFDLINMFYEALNAYYAVTTPVVTKSYDVTRVTDIVDMDDDIRSCMLHHLTDFIALLSHAEHQGLAGSLSTNLRVLIHLFDFLVLYNAFWMSPKERSLRTAIGLYEMAKELNQQNPNDHKLRGYLKSAEGLITAKESTDEDFGLQASASAWYFASENKTPPRFRPLKNAEQEMNNEWPLTYDQISTFRMTADKMGMWFDSNTLTLEMLIATRSDIRSAFYSSAYLGTETAVEFEFFLY